MTSHSCRCSLGFSLLWTVFNLYCTIEYITILWGQNEYLTVCIACSSKLPGRWQILLPELLITPGWLLITELCQFSFSSWVLRAMTFESRYVILIQALITQDVRVNAPQDHVAYGIWINKSLSSNVIYFLAFLKTRFLVSWWRTSN